jgi:hypothetical protein
MEKFKIGERLRKKYQNSINWSVPRIRRKK